MPIVFIYLYILVTGFDETSPHSPSLTSQKVRQMISKLIEDRLGEALDLVIILSI